MIVGLLCSLYLILFLLGIGSNVSAFIKTIKVYIWIRKYESESVSNRGSYDCKHLVWMTMILIMTNLALLLCLCFLISDVLSQGWHLGPILCGYYWWSENISKSFVAFILVAFSVERYLHSTNDQKWRLMSRSSLTVMIILVLASIMVIVLTAPLQPYVGVQNTMLDPTSTGAQIVNATKCGLTEAIPKWSLHYHILGSFLFSYVLPMIVATVCYVSIARRKKNAQYPNQRADHGSVSSLSSNPTNQSVLDRAEPLSRKITVITASMIGLYLISWSPYWLTTLMIQFTQVSHTSAFMLPFTLFVCHLLPYVNAMVSGLLFVALVKRVKLLKLSEIMYDMGSGQPQQHESPIKGQYREMTPADWSGCIDQNHGARV